MYGVSRSLKAKANERAGKPLADDKVSHEGEGSKLDL